MMMPALLTLALLSAKPLTVSVLPFDNRTGAAEYDVMEKGLSDMLLTDLAAADGLAVVERARLDEVITELKLQRSSLFDPKTVQQLGKVVGASHVVTGTLLKVDPELRLDVRLVEVKTARVLYGATVAGNGERLFELEQELVTRFLDGLGKKGMLPARSGPSRLDTLLAYSQAVDRADKGELKEASAALAAVMKSDTSFRLAKERYTDILKRLTEAGARREEVMSAGESELQKKVDEVLATEPDWATARPEQTKRWLGYLVLRSSLTLIQLRRLTGPDSLPSQANASHIALLRKAKRAAARPLLLTYVAQLQQYFAALLSARAHPKWHPHNSAEHTPDHPRALELGLGSLADDWGDEGWAKEQLAVFIFSGHHWNYDLLRQLTPSPADLEPSLVPIGLKLLDDAAAIAKANPDPTTRLMHGSRVALAHGDALLALGRREEAMARWQTALDEMPTAPDFSKMEERIQMALGVHKLWRDLDERLKVCDYAMTGGFAVAVHPLYPFDFEALFKRAEQAYRVCAPNKNPGMKATAFVNLAYAAGAVGDCPRFVRIYQRVKQIDTGSAAQIAGYAQPCLDDR